MTSRLRTRAFGPVVLALMLLTGLPGPAAATAFHSISGTITDKDSGLPIAGVAVVTNARTGGAVTAPVYTGSDGCYLVQIDAAGDLGDGYYVQLTDPGARYFHGAYRPYGMWVSFLLRVAVTRGVIPGVAGREGEIRNASTARAR
jgi:hypothetical protein